MKNFLKIAGVIIVGILAALLFSAVTSEPEAVPETKTLGGVYHNVKEYFLDGLSITSRTSPLGYAQGAGCSVTQATNRTTGVTCSGTSGQITTTNTSLAAAAEAEFIVTDPAVSAGDVIILSLATSTATSSVASVTKVTAGSFGIQLTNLNTIADVQASIINFAVVDAVSN